MYKVKNNITYWTINLINITDGHHVNLNKKILSRNNKKYHPHIDIVYLLCCITGQEIIGLSLSLFSGSADYFLCKSASILFLIFALKPQVLRPRSNGAGPGGQFFQVFCPCSNSYVIKSTNLLIFIVEWSNLHHDSHIRERILDGTLCIRKNERQKS